MKVLTSVYCELEKNPKLANQVYRINDDKNIEKFGYTLHYKVICLVNKDVTYLDDKLIGPKFLECNGTDYHMLMYDNTQLYNFALSEALREDAIHMEAIINHKANKTNVMFKNDVAASLESTIFPFKYFDKEEEATDDKDITTKTPDFLLYYTNFEENFIIRLYKKRNASKYQYITLHLPSLLYTKVQFERYVSNFPLGIYQTITLQVYHFLKNNTHYALCYLYNLYGMAQKELIRIDDPGYAADISTDVGDFYKHLMHEFQGDPSKYIYKPFYNFFNVKHVE